MTTTPKLWTYQRAATLGILAVIGVLQAGSALLVGISASQLLMTTGESPAGMAGPLAIAGGAVALVALRTLQKHWAERFALGYVNELRTQFMSHVMRLPINGKGPRFGLVMTRVVNDFSAIRLWLASGLVPLLVAASVLLTLGLYLAFTQPALLLTLAPALGLWGLVAILCISPLSRSIRESRRQRGRLASEAGSLLTGRLSLLVHGRHGASMRKLMKRSDMLRNALVRRATISGLLRAAGDLVFPMMVLASTAAGVLATGLTPHVLGLLIVATGLVVTQLSGVALAVDYRLAHNVAMTRLTTILARPTLDIDKGNAPFRRPSNGLHLEIGEFAFRADAPVVSFSAGPGSIVLITGVSRQELSRLFVAIMRIGRDVGTSEENANTFNAGRILLNGHDHMSLSRRDLWRSVTLVSSELALVGDTEFDMMRLGVPSHVDDDEIDRIRMRFGLGQDKSHYGEGVSPAPDVSAALRLARALLRRAPLILIEDEGVLRRPDLLDAFLDEASAHGATVLLGSMYCICINRPHAIIDVSAAVKDAA